MKLYPRLTFHSTVSAFYLLLPICWRWILSKVSMLLIKPALNQKHTGYQVHRASPGNWFSMWMSTVINRWHRIDYNLKEVIPCESSQFPSACPPTFSPSHSSVSPIPRASHASHQISNSAAQKKLHHPCRQSPLKVQKKWKIMTNSSTTLTILLYTEVHRYNWLQGAIATAHTQGNIAWHMY